MKAKFLAIAAAKLISICKGKYSTHEWSCSKGTILLNFLCLHVISVSPINFYIYIYLLVEGIYDVYVTLCIFNP